MTPHIIRLSGFCTSATVDFQVVSREIPIANRSAAERFGYNASMTLMNRIAAAAAEVRKKGGHPRRVLLRSDDAIQLQYELLAEGGKIGRAVMQDGVGKAVSRILGLQIVWRSARFSVV